MTTTNFPNGVTNATEGTNLGSFIMPDPTSTHVFFNDFDQYMPPYAAATTPAVAVPGDFVLSGATPGTIACASADGGVLTITNDDTDAHSTFAQWGRQDGNGSWNLRFRSGSQHVVQEPVQDQRSHQVLVHSRDGCGRYDASGRRQRSFLDQGGSIDNAAVQGC